MDAFLKAIGMGGCRPFDILRCRYKTLGLEGRGMTNPLVGENVTTTITMPFDRVRVGGYEPYFQLKEVQFERIKRGRPPILDYAWTVYGIAGGYGLSVLPKVLDQGISAISTGECITIGVISIACIAAVVLPRFQNNPRDEVMKEIDEFFKEELPNDAPIMIGERK